MDGHIKCLYCNGTQFHKSPYDPLSFLCANKECRHWFLWRGGTLPLTDLHRIEPTDAEKAVQANAEQLQRDREFSERMNIGAVYYRSHGSIAALRQRQLEERFTYMKPEQMDEICGFIMAMAEDIQALKQLNKVTLPDEAKPKEYRVIGELVRHLFYLLTVKTPSSKEFIGWAIDWLRFCPDFGPLSTEDENHIRDVYNKRE